MTMTVFASSEKIEVAVLSMQETDDHNLRVLFCVFETLPEGTSQPFFKFKMKVEGTREIPALYLFEFADNIQQTFLSLSFLYAILK